MAIPYAVEWTKTALAGRKALTDKVQIVVLDLVQALAVQAGSSQGEPADDSFQTYRDPATMVSVTYACDNRNRVVRIAHVAQPQVPVTPRLFISYSHKDRKWLEDLRRYLDVLEQKRLVLIWDDTCIAPGVDWLPAIEEAMRSARAALLLVTQDFLVSRFITNTELPTVIELVRAGGCTLLWVYVRTADFEMTPLRDIQALNDTKRPLSELTLPQRERLYKEIGKRVRNVVQPDTTS